MHKVGWAALAVGVMLQAGAASAQTPPPPSVITNPTWAARPDAEAMGEAYPGFAVSAGLDGDVTLRCTARTDGGLDLCEVRQVTPTGLGFDRAGLSLSRLFRVNPREVDGQDTKAQVQFTIRFRAERFVPSPPWTGPEPDAAHVANFTPMIAAMMTELEREFADSLQHTDVDTDRVDKVRAILTQAHAEFVDRLKEAGALTMARLVTREDFARFRTGGASPPEPSQATAVSAADRADAFMNDELQRRRELYCAQFDCPVLPAPPTDPVAPPQ